MMIGLKKEDVDVIEHAVYGDPARDDWELKLKDFLHNFWTYCFHDDRSAGAASELIAHMLKKIMNLKLLLQKAELRIVELEDKGREP